MKYIKCDSGRSQSKRPKQKNDCTVRALALATGKEYDDVYDELARQGRKCNKGFKNKEMFNRKDFEVFGVKFRWESYKAVKNERRLNSDTWNKTGEFIVRTAKHTAYVKDNLLYDTFPMIDRCIYGSWEIIR